ncbi:MAG TPA: beta-galactosidase, partial [Opitutales bacterium]|nr:beta-galactosidase [Opitutales bacterium]
MNPSTSHPLSSGRIEIRSRSTHRIPRSILRASLITAAFALIPAIVVHAETKREGWFEWPYAEAVPGSALDASEINHKPAGKNGAITVKDGVFVTRINGERIRFWGCNLSSNEAFVDAETADRLAKRLAQGGINIARLHHLDNPWSVDSAGSLWKPGSKDRIHIDPTQLDKLHRLIAALKDQGIYSNINLKVSRTHTVEDGFPPSIENTPQFQKRIDYFQRQIIDFQKDYARQLLTTVNPYTGLSPVEDPAVAVIEINNENSLLGMRTRDIGAGLHLLPEPFAGELAELWNKWLRDRYESPDSVREAWSANPTPLGIP